MRKKQSRCRNDRVNVRQTIGERVVREEVKISNPATGPALVAFTDERQPIRRVGNDRVHHAKARNDLPAIPMVDRHCRVLVVGLHCSATPGSKSPPADVLVIDHGPDSPVPSYALTRIHTGPTACGA